MDERLIMVDTSILIELFRKKDKENTTLLALVRQGYTFCISAITEFEIYTGAMMGQIEYWNSFLKRIDVFPFDTQVALKAAEINKELKKKRKQVAIADLFIAATTVANNIPLATLNKKHFDRIEGIDLI